jgi:muconate cycloisomerase
MAAAGVEACETPVVAVNRATANDHPDLITENADAAALSLARVRRETGMALIEHVADLGDAFTAAIVRHRAVDTVNVIPSQGGGVLRARRLIHAAQTAGISALLGSTIELGPGTAASVHLAVASENVSVSSDLVSPGLLVGDVCRNRLRFDSGYLRPFDGPGLGIELDEAQMAKWAVG